MALEQLSSGTTDVVVDGSGGVPRILHWGGAIGPTPSLDSVAASLEIVPTPGGLDVVPPVSLVPEHGSGWPGRPGLLGRRAGGRMWAPRFTQPEIRRDGATVVVSSSDRHAELSLVVEVELDEVLRVAATVTNTASASDYELDGLSVTMPLPAEADELLGFDGRWAREFQMSRRPWLVGSHGAENRRGRTSHQNPPLIFAGRAGFDEWGGEVWGVHLAWSGNHFWHAERLSDGRRYVQAGELLLPGEVTLGPGESYRTPDVLAVHHASGLTGATQQFHRAVRSGRAHPTAPRKVMLNTWEAVYFDHDDEKLRDLADRAARVGVERFVLDDGWFSGRRDDSSSLGDWTVSPEVYPRGLAPLIDHVRAHGMDFGIWVEPEMVSPDSDLFREHPEWVLGDRDRDPITARHQLVLDLTRPEAYAHVLGQLDALLRDHDITYLKWDMNRDHVAATDATGSAGTHGQTLAVYRMMDEIRRRHPEVEIESCASGGGRIDLEVLRRAERVWPSDSNDALERQTIQRGVSMLVPPERVGAHIGPERSHTSGRRHDLEFRAITALFGHLGIEWNLLSLTEEELDDLTAVVAAYRRLRSLLHTGEVVRYDTTPDLVAHGVMAADRTEALVAVARVATSSSLLPAPLRIRGLAPDLSYTVRRLELMPGREQPVAPGLVWALDGIQLSGRQLAAHGLQLPRMDPESALVLQLGASH